MRTAAPSGQGPRLPLQPTLCRTRRLRVRSGAPHPPALAAARQPWRPAVVRPLCRGLRRILLCALAGLASPIFAAPAEALADQDPVLLRFVTVGDSRQDPTLVKLSPQDRHWAQNTPVLSYMLQAMQQQQPQLLFFNGDMVMGYEALDAAESSLHPAKDPEALAQVSGYVQLYSEYAYWRGLLAPMMEHGTYVVPVPGNHEVQNPTPGMAGKRATLANEQAWRANMGDLILDRPRFATLLGAAPSYFSGDDPDPLRADAARMDQFPASQKQLSFSFDVAHQHFVVLDTDPFAHDSEVAVHWLDQDLRAAVEERHVEHVFVFGHKPAYPYQFSTDVVEQGLGERNPANREQFWQVINAWHATYFCGHEHIYHVDQPGLAKGQEAWQVIVGSGGSPFSAENPKVQGVTAHPATDRTYAWAMVEIRASGRVSLRSFGFDRVGGPIRSLDEILLAKAAKPLR